MNHSKKINLKERIFTSAVLVIIILPALLLGSYIYAIILSVIGITMAKEWVTILSPKQSSYPFNFLSIAVIIIILSSTIYPNNHILGISLLIGGFLCSIFISLMTKKKLSLMTGGYFYILIPLYTLILIRTIENGVWFTLYIISSVSVSDIFAMIFGKMIGGIKLSPNISPNKTWSGFIGSIIGSALVSLAFYWHSTFFNIIENVHYFTFIIVGILIAIVSQMGDLFESWIKRRHNVKDSGNILPGHGGVLDRFDGLIFVLFIIIIILYIRRFDALFSVESLFNWF